MGWQYQMRDALSELARLWRSVGEKNYVGRIVKPRFAPRPASLSS